ncbi:MAG: DEAD/DEAH box helicase [Candidatus Woesearchaeota archaeon]
MIKNFEPRLYQQTILGTAANKNTLVVLPTGLGKTNIFLMLASQRLDQYPNSKILLIGPTRPLIDQYMQVFLEHFEIEKEKMAVFTGMVSPEKRKGLWQKAKIVFSTPQGLENDIITKRISLEEVSLLGVDEAHRAVGDYAYVFVAKQYCRLARHPRVIAMTASPGSDITKIQEVCDNLCIEAIEARTTEDPDVKPYVQDTVVEWVHLSLPPALIRPQYHLQKFLQQRMEKLKSWGVLRRTDIKYVSKTDLLQLQAELRGRALSGEKDFVLWNAISLLAEIMKVSHALELVETQGIRSSYQYMDKLRQEGEATKTKAVKNIIKDADFNIALHEVKRLCDEGMIHPKLSELKKIVEQEIQKGSKMLIFNQYRDNAVEIRNEISKIEGARCEIFVGQMKKGDTGLSQKEQKELLDKFRSNELNILVATSVGEEGIDIPKVDLVVFYEPIPSAIRQIQRRGRTGRQEEGRVIVLMTKNSRDEAYRWSAHHKEKQMHRNLLSLKKKIRLQSQKETLEQFVEEKIIVYADHREKGGGVIKELIAMNVDLRLEQLQSADYVLSSRAGVEYKTVKDFADSIIDGRLLHQLKQLKDSFERPLIIIEGEEDLYTARNIHPNAIRGMMATIALSYKIPIIRTKNCKETAEYLKIIARREQEGAGKEYTPHARKPLTLKEQQEYVVGSLPGVGAALAKPLLVQFKTIKKLINAKEEALQKVEKIGPEKARKIKEVVETEYDNRDS